MIRHKWIWITILSCVGAMIACGGPAQEQQSEEGQNAAGLPATDPTKYAVTLWKKDISWYGTWELLPGTEEKQLSRGNPHGMYGTLYGNPLAIAAAKGNIERMPEGAIIVRENYNKEQEVLRITVARKTNGNWFWGVYNQDGTVELAGNLKACIQCHSEAPHDMLFFWNYSNDTE